MHPLAARLARGDRLALSRAITLLESSRRDHRASASRALADAFRIEKSELVNGIDDGKKSLTARERVSQSFRVGLTGPPGAGKSTLIEALGLRLLGECDRDGSVSKSSADNGKRSMVCRALAVLAVDPSSSRTGGSILGDKTRMTELSRHGRAFVRPSPTRGTLGGVTRCTQEAVSLCEVAGFDLTLIETVGVGQSETAVEQMVDMFILVVPPAAGDELQGVKKGVMELADLVVVNKADGELKPSANRAATQYGSALRLSAPKVPFWRPRVVTCSAATADGLSELLDVIAEYRTIVEQSEGSNTETRKERRRAEQRAMWLRNALRDGVLERLRARPDFGPVLESCEAAVRSGDMTPGMAADELLDRLNI